MSELLPCPFCGGEARIFALQIGKGWRVVCSKPFCAQGPNGDTEAEATAAWNARHERTCHLINLGGLAGSVPLFMCKKCESLFYGNARGEAPNYCPSCGAKVVVA